MQATGVCPVPFVLVSSSWFVPSVSDSSCTSSADDADESDLSDVDCNPVHRLSRRRSSIRCRACQPSSSDEESSVSMLPPVVFCKYDPLVSICKLK